MEVITKKIGLVKLYIEEHVMKKHSYPHFPSRFPESPLGPRGSLFVGSICAQFIRSEWLISRTLVLAKVCGRKAYFHEMFNRRLQ